MTCPECIPAPHSITTAIGSSPWHASVLFQSISIPLDCRKAALRSWHPAHRAPLPLLSLATARAYDQGLILSPVIITLLTLEYCSTTPGAPDTGPSQLSGTRKPSPPPPGLVQISATVSQLKSPQTRSPETWCHRPHRLSVHSSEACCMQFGSLLAKNWTLWRKIL